MANFAAIGTTYTTPTLGDTVQVLDNGYVYRFNGTGWIYTQGYSATAIADVNAQLADIANTLIKGTDGKKYKIVACTLRSTNNVWEIISDSIHHPINVLSVSSDADKITLFFNFESTGIGSLVCTPDDTYAQYGLQFGASVGTGQAIITPRVNRTIGGYITCDGTNFSVANCEGITSAAWSADKLVITHPSVEQAVPNIYKSTVAHRGGNYIAQMGGMGTLNADVEFYDFTGTRITTPNINMKIYFTRPISGKPDMDTLDISGSNIWVFGIFEVAQ